jgi:hypothetical protein
VPVILGRLPQTSPDWPGQKPDSISKITKAKRAGDIAQVVKHLSTKHEALNSNIGITTKKLKNSL